MQIRIGIHTGLVVFGTVGGNLRMDPTAIGDAANVAARLQASAEPGTILISEETCRLAEGYVQRRAAGLLALKGKDELIAAYRLLGVSHRRLPRRPGGGAAVCRSHERDRPLDNLVRAAEGAAAESSASSASRASANRG